MSEYISKYTGSEIDDGIAKAKTALQSLPAHTHSYNDLSDKPTVSASVAYNLLDNSDFRNPVNQRGNTTYTVAGYTIDRWIASSAHPVTLTENGVKIDATNGALILRQRLSSLADGVYTLVVKANNHVNVRQYQKSGTTYTKLHENSSYSGGYTALLNNTYPEVQIRANAGNIVTVEWVALYEGAYTADAYPAYVPKGYAVELTECMRYFVARDPSAHGFTSAAEYGLFKAVIPMPMRVVPSVAFSDSSAVGYVRVSGSQHVSSLSNISVNGANGNVITIKVLPNDSFTHIRHAAVFFSENTLMYFSADL